MGKGLEDNEVQGVEKFHFFRPGSQEKFSGYITD